MPEQEVYQLTRDKKESTRLNEQHRWIRDLCYGNLVHKSIPLKQVKTIADIGTGTGIWMEDLAAHLKASPEMKEKKFEFVGFDLSSDQFPAGGNDTDAEFVVHNVMEPFPVRYHGKFDLIHIRLLVAALRPQDLQGVILNISELLRPGGFLHWQDSNSADWWAHPFSAVAQSLFSRQSEMKLEIGLSLCFVTDLLKALFSTTTILPADAASIDIPNPRPNPHPNPVSPSLVEPATSTRVNRVNYTNDLFSLMAYESFPSASHPSPDVRATGHRIACNAWNTILGKGARGLREKAREAATTEEEEEVGAKLIAEAEEIERLLAEQERESSAGTFQWLWCITDIVAQKAVTVAAGEDWLNALNEKKVG